jgi:hypothetical protein
MGTPPPQLPWPEVFLGRRSGDVALIEPVTNSVQVPGKPFVHKADRMVGAIDKELSGTSAFHPSPSPAYLPRMPASQTAATSVE